MNDSSPFAASLAIITPIMLFFAALPASAPRWLLLVHGAINFWTPLAVVLVATLAALVLYVARDDIDIAFGTLTFFYAWLTILTFVSVFLRDDNVSHGPVTFAVLLVLTVVALGFTAHDWSRRLLIAAALVAVLAFGAFVVRVGFDDLQVPSQDQRQAIADAAETTKAQIIPGQVEQSRAILAATLNRYRSLVATRDLIDSAFKVLSEGSDEAQLSPSTMAAFENAATTTSEKYAIVKTAVSDAVHAFEDAKSLSEVAGSSPALEAAIKDVKDTPTDGAEWLKRKRKLDIALASYRAQVTGSEADLNALNGIQAQPLQTVTRVLVLDALNHGPEALWLITVHSADPLLPGPLIWAIIGLLALGGWAWLLAINAAQMPGPVTVAADKLGKAPDTDTKKDGKDTQIDLQTVLRIAVLQNVPEPGASPGADATNPVTDILGIGASLTGIASVVELVLKITGRRYGYEIDLDLSKEPKGLKPWIALVRVKTLGGGRTLASQTVREETEVQAVRAGGYWAAGYVLNRSTRIPTWAAWNAETAEALAKSTRSNQSREQLEEAVAKAPNSGVLLVALGHAFEIAGGEDDRRRAIAYYARAVAAHPRYVVARYRLAVGLGMMRHDQSWATLSLAARQQMLRPVRSAAAAVPIDLESEIDKVRDAETAKDVKEAFKNLATKLLKRFRDDSTKRRLLAAALRRSDRDWILRALMPQSLTDRAPIFSVAESALLSLGPVTDLDKLSKKATRPKSWWQMSYNAACGLANYEKEKEKALSMLEQTLTHPGVQQLEKNWAQSDPDLAPLREHPRFEAFVSQLSRGS